MARTVSKRIRLGIERTPVIILLVPAQQSEYDHVRPRLTSYQAFNLAGPPGTVSNVYD
jgi:hypothetical protein